MKAIVEEYARGEFEVKRPEVEISVARLALEVEAGFQESYLCGQEE